MKDGTESFGDLWSESSQDTSQDDASDDDPDGNDPSNSNHHGGDPPKDLHEVLDYIVSVFDNRIALFTEASLSTSATLLLDGPKSCSGLAGVGPPGTGKTTVCDFFKDAEYNNKELNYWSDDVTPAAFVSHDPSRSEAELEETDLLPKIRGITLINPDMASWFSGSEEQIRAKMAKIARAMDGEGLRRDTASHGGRGYSGDYRFAIVGATTPLSNMAWRAMGHVGNRLVFHTIPREENRDVIANDVFSDGEYGDKVEQCREVVTEFLENVWTSYGGNRGVDWTSTADESIQDNIAYLSQLVAHSRTPGNGVREGEHRIMGNLRDIARGHALLDGREELTLADLDVCARIALSTMHKERRGIVRAVVDPNSPNRITSGEIANHHATSATRKTLRDRMELLEKLGLGEVLVGDSARETRKFELDDKFVWPSSLRFPHFGR